MGRRNKHNDLYIVLTCMHGQVGRVRDISPKDLGIINIYGRWGTHPSEHTGMHVYPYSGSWIFTRQRF